jgi:hypothetical protein
MKVLILSFAILLMAFTSSFAQDDRDARKQDNNQQGQYQSGRSRYHHRRYKRHHHSRPQRDQPRDHQ